MQHKRIVVCMIYRRKLAYHECGMDFELLSSNFYTIDKGTCVDNSIDERFKQWKRCQFFKDNYTIIKGK